MSASRHPLRWVPAFFVGVSAATAAEVAVGLLLYSGPGLARSLTTVLGVEAAAIGVGLWMAPGPRPDLLDSLRHRWLLCLVAFLAATLFSAFWSVLQVMGGSALGQGLGLALLGGLPLYACGGVLGAMAAVNAGEPAGGGTPTGAPAFLGAALGFGATGLSLPQTVTPASLLLVCLVLLSAGGLVYGAVLDAHLRVYVRARRVASMGDVRVEDRYLLTRGGSGRVLLERDHVRRWVPLGTEPIVPWDVAVFRHLLSVDDGPRRVLLVGGGASTLPRAVALDHPGVSLDVTERTAEVLELAQEHMDADFPKGDDARVRLHVGNTDDLVEEMGGPYDLILVDSASYEVVGGMHSMSRRIRDLLTQRLDSDGALAVGPVAPGDDVYAPPEQWVWTRYRRPVEDDMPALALQLPEQEVVLVARPLADAVFPEEMDGFVREPAEGPR